MINKISRIKKPAKIIAYTVFGIMVICSLIVNTVNTFADSPEGSGAGRDDLLNDDGADPTGSGGSGSSEPIEIDADSPFPSEQCTSGFGGTSWVLCPGIETISEGTNGIYNLLAEELVLSSSIVSTDSKTGATYMVWDYVRGFSNVILIIFMVIVILSQITGYGINNYGIKRMLPRIIIAAILINISYILCQIAVDISNILGSSLGKELNGVAHTIANNIPLDYNGMNFIRIVVGILVAALGGGVVVFRGIQLGAGSGAILSIAIGVLFLLLIIGLAVLIFFAMLAIRQILAMLCVAFSPVAIACMILPNTEGIYKRWLKLVQAILIIYPICSVLYGMSSIIEIFALAPSNGKYGFLQLIVASIACFVPFYAAPVLMVKALNGIGNIGSAVQGLGRRGRQGLIGLNRGALSSERLKRRREQGVDEHRVRTFQRNQQRKSSNNALVRWWGNHRTNSALNQQRYVEAQQSILKREDAEAKNKDWISNSGTMMTAERNKSGEARRRTLAEAGFQASSDYVSASINELDAEMDKKRSTAHLHASTDFATASRNETAVTTDKMRRELAQKATDEFRQAGINENVVAADKMEKELARKSNARFLRAGLNENEVNADRMRREDATKLSDEFVRAGINENAVNENKNRLDIEHKASDKFVTARQNQDEVSYQRLRNETELFNNNQYLKQRQTNVDTAMSNELIKMYRENFATMNKAQLGPTFDSSGTITSQGEFLKALRNSGDENAKERAVAAYSSLMDIGGVKEMFQAVDQLTQAEWGAMDPGVRQKMLEQFAASSDVLAKGYGKAQLAAIQSLRPVQTLSDYLTAAPTAGTNTSFGGRVSIVGEHALDSAGKDTLEVIANTAGAAKHINNASLVNALTTKTNGEEITHLNSILSQKIIDAAAGQTFCDQYNGQRLASMSLSTFNTLQAKATANGANVATWLNKAVTELQKAENAQLLARLDPQIRSQLGI